MTTFPIEPRDNSYGLRGRVVTMNDAFEILESAVVYINQGLVVDVRPSTENPPNGFDPAHIIDTGGTIFPGMIELHNHLSYDVLPMWNVPELFERREQWRDHPEKRKLVTAPMYVLGRTPGYVEAVVRYVECKCLLAGVTTSQGISLYGVSPNRYYRGIVRNVESPSDPDLSKAATKISDVKKDDATKFLARLDKEDSCFLLHLAEGVGEKALKHFKALELESGEWAITDALAGIHSTALQQRDLNLMAEKNAAVIWSPLSNLLLYARTTDIKSAKEAGMLIGLGSDWSPSGSKNLLGELKVAHLVNNHENLGLTNRDIVSMVTCDAAKILKWDRGLGSIEGDKRADLIVVEGQTGDVYDMLIQATESSIHLVVINGVPRYGMENLMGCFGNGTEAFQLKGEKRLLNLWEETADPAIRDLTLKQAQLRLEEGFSQLPVLAERLESPDNAITRLSSLKQNFTDLEEAYTALGFSEAELASAVDGGVISHESPPIFLHLDMDEGVLDEWDEQDWGTGFDLDMAASVPYSEILRDVNTYLDPLTIVEDARYFQNLAVQRNIPIYIKEELPGFYGAVIPPSPVANDFLTEEHANLGSLFASVVNLATFMGQPGYLTSSHRRQIVEQALILLDDVYVHLPLKRAMHAVDPVQRLKLLLFDLEQADQVDVKQELEFHAELLSIFSSLRDLHTIYKLPYPYAGKVAFLPFMIEEYFAEDNKPRYIVTNTTGDIGPDSFQKNVEILYWNGIPIERAIQLNAEKHAGSNLAARHARGLDTMTIRPLGYSLPPDEEWVTLRYQLENGQIQEFTQDWLVTSTSIFKQILHKSEQLSWATAIGIDEKTDAVHQIKKALFAPEALLAERRVLEEDQPQSTAKSIATQMPTVFRALSINEKIAYIRIFTFNVPSADKFVEEFVRLANEMKAKGLIIDIRGNGGGLIYAAERLLQFFTEREIEPERAQFINSPLTLRLCRLHSPSAVLEGLDLTPWVNSIELSVKTGAKYSLGYPITDRASCNSLQQKFTGSVVLIVDAMCYSAADMFAAGFQDHEIGKILSVSENTGAGGANVWSHELLEYLMNSANSVDGTQDNSPFEPLPHGAAMRVAIRRTLRVNQNAGMPLEDLGIQIKPEHRYWMKKEDLLNGNKGLIKWTSEFLFEG